MYKLPTQIKHNNKIFREAGFSYADCKAYKNGNHRILVNPDGSIFHCYDFEDNYAREV